MPIVESKDFTHGDLVVADMKQSSDELVPLEEAKAGIIAAVTAFKQQAEALKASTYKGQNFKDVAQAMGYTLKVIDGAARLLSFLSGGPDSRPDLASGLKDLLPLLSDDEFKVLQARVAEAERVGAQAVEEAEFTEETQ